MIQIILEVTNLMCKIEGCHHSAKTSLKNLGYSWTDHGICTCCGIEFFPQFTAASLTGVFGSEPKKRGIQMLKKDWVHIIASDAHNLYGRKPEIEPGRMEAAKVVGEDRSWEMVKHLPAKLAAKHFKS